MTIPTEIGMKLTNLEAWSMSSTGLVGSIPSEIGLLTNLQRVWLYRNDLTGTVPTEVGQLQSLQFLYLHKTMLTGTMPTQVCENRMTQGGSIHSLGTECIPEDDTATMGSNSNSSSIYCPCCSCCGTEQCGELII